MPRRINASSRSELQRGLALVRKDMERVTRDLSHADSEPVKEAAKHGVKVWREILNTRGGGEPSPPGSPPHRQVGQLRRSISHAVVDGVRRVGTSHFVARLMEEGTEKHPPRPHGGPAMEAAIPKLPDVIADAGERIVRTARI